jgi:hypothetical protein
MAIQALKHTALQKDRNSNPRSILGCKSFYSIYTEHPCNKNKKSDFSPFFPYYIDTKGNIYLKKISALPEKTETKTFSIR